MLGAGCVDVNGGAVELKWSIRDAIGPSNCGTSRLDTVDLVYSDEAAHTFKTSFPCSEPQATTLFSIPPGRYSFSIEPQCASSPPPAPKTEAKVTVPSPIVRDVANGELTDLKVLLIMVDATDPSVSRSACD